MSFLEQHYLYKDEKNRTLKQLLTNIFDEMHLCLNFKIKRKSRASNSFSSFFNVLL